MNAPAGWFPDPSGSGTRRYFDGTRWVDGDAAVASTTVTPAAGWYPDPEGTPRRRFFDGQAWTDRYAADSNPGEELPARFLLSCVALAVVLLLGAGGLYLAGQSGAAWLAVLGSAFVLVVIVVARACHRIYARRKRNRG